MSPMTSTENMCFRKAVFNSRPEADRYIGNMNRYTRRGGRCPRGVHPYRCPFCNKYHVGNKGGAR